jgi:hypothetical protein
MEYVISYEEFVNEGLVTIKRKYTDNYPSKEVAVYAPIREKILSFVSENGKVTHEQMMEFIKAMNEEKGGVTSRKWLNKNERYFVIAEKNGIKTYSLSGIGKKVHDTIKKLNASL